MLFGASCRRWRSGERRVELWREDVKATSDSGLHQCDVRVVYWRNGGDGNGSEYARRRR